MLCVLKGGFQFFSDLQARLKALVSRGGQESFQLVSEFVRCKSYVNDSSTNEVREIREKKHRQWRI